MAGLDDAYARLRAGDWAGAEALLQALPPGGTADAGEDAILRARALAAQLAGRGDDAVALMHRAAERATHPQAAIELSQLLSAAGRGEDALRTLEAATGRHPGSADAWYARGMALYQAGRDQGARDAFAQALALTPGQPVLVRALAEAEYALERHVQALPLFAALAGDAPDAALSLRLSQCHRRLGDADAALRVVQTALQRFAGDAPLWLEAGWVHEDRGDAAAASAAYARAAELRPDWGDPVGASVALLRREAPEPMLSRARALAARTDLPATQRAYLHMALGKQADAARDFDAAAAHWAQGNALRRAAEGGFDRDAYRAQVDGLIAAFGRDVLQALHARALRDPRPVFVLGMPRSGTTLAEQVLAAHPQAFGCGERVGIVDIAHACAALPGIDWPREAARVDPAWLQARARDYLADTARLAPAGTARLVDKQPYNFLHVGLLSLLFADARVVWCRRDPRDIAVSIFGENFSPLATYATDLDDIAFVIAQHERLMRHWQQAAPLPILELQYEQVVADPEAQIRRLVDFAGLPWDDACLAFHATGRSVQTMSRWQVRQPVYGASVGRWRRHPQWFGAEGEGAAAPQDAPRRD